jgi:polyisoprenyl-teichoic acid--peptidoglycan teichoic acid transferase
MDGNIRRCPRIMYPLIMYPKYNTPLADPNAETQPNYTVELLNQKSIRRVPKKSKPWMRGCGLFLLLIFLFFCAISSIYAFFPARTNLLVLGIDRAPDGTAVARSDTNILFTLLPLRPYIGMLSIPRDLWVSIPGIGENRINTAHFFAEATQAGSGPQALMETIRQNFGVPVNYYARVNFQGLVNFIDALGGLDVRLDTRMAGYKPGRHHLSGEEVLAFVRDRQGTDDFFRMQQGQFIIKAIWGKLLQPNSWARLPLALSALPSFIDTNLPPWIWPRIGIALLRLGSDGIDSRVITREMTNPFTTSEGAQVLGPNWDLINPMITEMFGS